MTEVFEANFKEVSKYVHATSRGHEAIQIALGMQLLPQDYVFPYYRDDAMLLAMGMTPYDLMLQVLTFPLPFAAHHRRQRRRRGHL